VDRLACLELRAFPLQLVLRARADWRGEPTCIVDRDAPQGLILWVNEDARAGGVLPGQRYGAALGLCARLRAATITADEVAAGVAELVRELQAFTPVVEPCADEPGVAWLELRGLQRLFGTPARWAHAVLERIRALGFEGHLAVGFRRFTVYAAVKALGRSTLAIFDDRAHEARVTAGVSLARLPIDPAARDALAKLAITTLGAFARLPSSGIRARFGPDVHRLHRMAAGAFDDDIAPAEERIPHAAHVDLDLPEGAVAGILHHAEELLQRLVAPLARGGEGVAAVTLRLDLDDGNVREERIVPASATCAVDWLVRLLRMRLEGLVLARGANRIAVTLARVPLRAEQATLFAAAKRRPERAAAKAFSALRATYGEDAVVRARLVSAHLPEYRFVWERCDGLARPAPQPVHAPPLVRCFLAKPLALPPRGRHEPDGWLLRGVTHGSVTRLHGPHRISGGWWRAEVRREYHFAELTSGTVAWIYYDDARRRWYLQGEVS
jgi:protein ImuB